MKVSVSDMPGPASARVPSQSAADGKDQPAFDAVLQDAEKPADARTSSRTERQSSRAAQSHPLWPKFVATPTQAGKDDEIAAAALETDDAIDKTPEDREAEDHRAERAKNRRHHDEPQFDRLPLLMALHDLRRISETTAGADLSPVAGDEALNGPSLKAETAALARPTPEITGTRRTDAAPKNQAIAAQNYPMGQAPADPTAQEEPGSADVAALKAGSTAEGSVEARSPSGRQGPLSESVTVVREQNFASPAPHPISQTAAGLVNALAADSVLPQALSAPSAAPQPTVAVAQPTHMLKIELHPAELGMVTASLRLVGGQLSIELTPENQEAHRRLSSDADAIIKSLRGLGFDVDKVSILQPQIAVNASPRTDATGTATGSMGRDQSSFQPGNSGGNGADPGSQQSGRNRNDDVSSPGRTASNPRDGTGGNLFI